MACSYAFTGKDGKPVLITGKENFKAWLAENLDKVAPGWNTQNQSKVKNTAPDTIDDFGEKIEGARKDMQASVSKEWTDDEIASQPFSKIWPATDIDAISDPFEAAVMFAAREEVPSKPRVSYKLKAWVAKVKMFRELVSRVIGDVGRDRYLEKMKEYGGLDSFRSKVMLLEALDRSQWKRIGQVDEYPNAYVLNDGKKVPTPQSVVEIDGKRERFDGSGSVLDALDKINEKLGVAVEPKKMQFEVRGREGFYGINKKGDKEYRKLKTFATSKEAFAYIKDNYDDLVAAWDGVKDRDNVGKADVRNDTNRPRTGSDWRKGKDVTPAQFSDAFGFRGVQFGNWVSQGAGGKDRQGMLNQAYDALMDLADIVGVPPKAISLNGSLGLAFGARGSGNASAHYEPSNLVINLTKTKGAGTLAHEWFHALDNYFSRQRGGEVRIGRGVNAQEAYRTQNYITYRPEPMYVHKTQRSTPITKAQLERYHDRSPQSAYYNIQNWQVDPTHPQGVRPEVERAFADLVEALDNSPMKVRSAKNDKGADGYWSRIIERGARSFENYVIHKMRLKGYDNDYLANVRKVEDFPRDSGRYPYLLDEEVAPVAEAFDNLFSEVKTKETEQGVALFSRGKSGSVIHPDDFDAKMRQFKRAFPGVQIIGHDSDQAPSVPRGLRASIKRQGATGDVKGAYHDGEIHIFRNAIPDIATLEFTVLHENTHFGLSSFMGASLDEVMLDINQSNPQVAKVASRLQRQYGYSVARSTEEALADLGGDMVKVKGWQKFVAAVRDWLRKHGFVSEWSDNDIAALVMRARDYAKDKNATTVYRGSVFKQGETQELRMSRASILTPAQRALTKTDKFAEWFGNSKMKAQDGTPLLFMHGTPSNFEAFSNDSLGSSSSHTSAGLGHFFTRDMATAQKYAQGGTVLKGWLRIERPYVMPLKEAQGFEDTKASAARRVVLQKQGYDGAVILDDQGKPWAMVAFEPWQYKTTDNRGTFDEFDDRMRFSRQNQGMDDENNVAGKQAPTPAGDVEAGGATPRFTPRNWREWYELPQFQSDDQSTVLFNHGHGGYIKQVEARTSGVFDGLFALPDPGMTERGPDVTAFRIPDNKMLSQRDLDYELDSDEVSAALIDVFPRKIEAGGERFDSAWSAVVEDKSDYESLGLEDDGSIREDSFMDILGYSAEDAGEASWFAQKLRGRLAAKLGYQAVQMDDENGSSWYIVPGVKSIPLNDPSASASSDAKFSRSGQAALGTLTADQQAAVDRVFGKPKTTAERVKEFTKDWKKNLIQGVFDQYAPIKELDSKGYVLARLAKGGDSTLEAMLLYGKVSVDNDGAYQVDYDGKNMNGFAKAMGKLDGEHDRFLAWVSGMRAESLAGLGLENLMTAQDIKALKSLGTGQMQNGKPRAAAYAEALRSLNEFNDSVLKVAVDSGLIDEATRQMYKDTPYVPFYRLSEEDAIQGPTVSKGLVNQSAWRKLKGGTDKLNEDLMGNLLKNWSHLITASANNRAAKQILDTAAQMGVATDMTNDVVAQDINGQPIYRSNTKGLVRYRGEIKRKIPAGQPYVENGQTLISDGTAEISYVGDRYFKVDDPHLMDAIASIGFTQKAWKPLATFKRLLTFGVTVNPTFKIRNLIRDSIQAIGTADLSANPVKNILMGAKGTEMLSQTRAQMLASGGMLRFGSAEGGYSAHVRRLIEKGVDPAHILDNDNKIKALWKHKILPAFEAYQEFGDRFENVNRAALYEQLKAKGMSHAEASFWARDMMDFSMSGKWQAVRTLTAVVPFMNARLQGIYKLGRATKQDYKRMGATLAAVSIASITLMMHYSDDDDWKKREDWDRDNSWWFKIGDTAYRIPKPFEIGAIGTIAERSVELVISDEMTGKRFANRMRDLVMQNLSMNPTPQLVKPMIDLYANKDSFSGRDIETQGMERMRPQDRYTERTSEVGRFLGSLGLPNPAQLMMGRVESLSPVQIDHLIRGYFSWLGTSATTVLDYGLRPMMDRGETPERRLKDIFLVGNFVESLPSGSSRYVTEFYNQAKEIEQMYASYQQAMKEGDAEKAEEIKEEGADKFAKRGLFNAVKRQESEISAQMRQIERDKTLSAAEKRERLSDLEDRRDRLARRAL